MIFWSIYFRPKPRPRPEPIKQKKVKKRPASAPRVRIVEPPKAPTLRTRPIAFPEVPRHESAASTPRPSVSPAPPPAGVRMRGGSVTATPSPTSSEPSDPGYTEARPRNNSFYNSNNNNSGSFYNGSSDNSSRSQWKKTKKRSRQESLSSGVLSSGSYSSTKTVIHEYPGCVVM